MTTQQKVEISITAKDGTKQAIVSAGNGLEWLEGRVTKLSVQLSAAKMAWSAVSDVIRTGMNTVTDWVREAGKGQEAVAGMTQAMVSMGRYTPQLQKNLLDVASSLQEVTTFEDDATIQGQKFLLTYRNITDDLLPRTSEVMLDLAAMMSGDVVQAANMLGKASMGMTGELRRVGITISESTFKARGFAGALEEVGQQVGGQARAKAQTGIGPWKQLANLWGDSKKNLGELTLAISKDLVPVLNTMLLKTNAAVEGFQMLFDQSELARVKKQMAEISDQIRFTESYLKRPAYQRMEIPGQTDEESLRAQKKELEQKLMDLSRRQHELSVGKGGKPSLFPGVAGASDELKKQMEKIAEDAYDAWEKRWKDLSEENASNLRILGFEQDAADAQKKEMEAIADEVHAAYQARMQQLGDENQAALNIFNMQQDAYFDDLANKASENSEILIKLSERTAEAMEQNFSDLFFDVITWQFDSLADYATGFLESIQRAIADYMGQVAKELAFGKEGGGSGWVGTAVSTIGMAASAYFGGGLGGGDYYAYSMYAHQGGTVGDNMPMRKVPASLFHNAPRLHKGLMDDEYPAILQSGERVIPRGGGPVTKVYIINNGRGEVTQKSSKNNTGGMDIFVTIEEKLAGNVGRGRGPLYKTMRDVLGINPTVGAR